MSASVQPVQAHSKSTAKCKSVLNPGAIESLLRNALKDVHALVPPLWPLKDYVAVNPFFGLANRPFLHARQSLKNVRNCDLLMPFDYFRSAYQEGRISANQIATAHRQCVNDYPGLFANFKLTELIPILEQGPAISDDSPIRFRTVAEAIDTQKGSTWTSHILNDITRHCSTHYDEGQALWSSPWKGESLYTAWREGAKFSHRLDLLGLTGFRRFVAGLSADPFNAISDLLMELDVPRSHWAQFLLCEIFSVSGWASYVRYQVREAENVNQQNDDLVGLVAIRLAYDVALARKIGIEQSLSLWPAVVECKDGLAVPPTPSTDVLARYVLQVAMEHAYQHELLTKLNSRVNPKPHSGQVPLQMVFCIDVRSEVLRRNLEFVDDSIETFGFAGFFGMPLEFIPMGSENTGTQQCPVLLKPSFQVHETLRGVSPQREHEILQKRDVIRRSRKSWKLFQNSASSCFSFVESMGLAYVSKILTDSLHWTKPVVPKERDGLSEDLISRLGLDVQAKHDHGLSIESRIDLAERMLRNLGLTSGFARIVAFCGHASDVTNNHYRAALDCGACGGHSGKPNARVAAALLNDHDVRLGLAARGIDIPTDTFFLAAWHNTTTDVVEICDPSLIPESHQVDFKNIQETLEKAGDLCRLERSSRLNSPDVDDILRRSRDWAEVRPELGLANNAAFIIAPRSRTSGIDLGGRTFLHSYDSQTDPDSKVLEAIMTAPMVVTNWINMQYYASSVDPVAFGSGNKVIHNIVGQFGVLEGNGGDLMTGLPWQSVHDGKQLLHEPLRLLVVIDALRSSVQRIIERQPLVRDLVTNGWITLTVWEGTEFFQWSAKKTWEPVSMG